MALNDIEHLCFFPLILLIFVAYFCNIKTDTHLPLTTLTVQQYNKFYTKEGKKFTRDIQEVILVIKADLSGRNTSYKFKFKLQHPFWKKTNKNKSVIGNQNISCNNTPLRIFASEKDFYSSTIPQTAVR